VTDSYAKPQASGTLDRSLASNRVVRGGGYRSEPRYCRSATREPIEPGRRRQDNMDPWYGFRVARDFQPGDTQDRRTGSGSSPRSNSPVAPVGSGGANSTAATGPAGLSVARPQLPPDAEGSPEEVLRNHGLTRSGAFFVLASEAEILDKSEKVRPLIASMAQPFKMFSLALRNDMLLAEAEAYLNEMRARVDAANAVLSKMPNGNKANSLEKQEYQRAQTALDGLTEERDNSSRMVDALRAQQFPAGRKEEFVKDFNVKWSGFLKAANELTPLIDNALSEYRKLQGDPQVRDALASFRRSTKVEALLGPSKDLRKAADSIKDAKRKYAPETAAPKKKGGRRMRP
jgi:hypothetical protein